MPTEFKDITITRKPDPEKVQKVESSDSHYRFPFPISSIPSKEWVEVLEKEWSYRPVPLKDAPHIKEPPRTVFDDALPKYQKEQVKINFEDAGKSVQHPQIVLQCALVELPVLSGDLVTAISSTNQKYRGILEHRDQEQRVIKESIDNINLS
jgi:hypothetical protein